MTQPLPLCVIGPQFIAPDGPDPYEIIVDKYSPGAFVITDINHRILIKVKPCDTRFHYQQVLLDPNDIPIVTLRDKNMTLHDRWNVFTGESSDKVFSAKTEHMIQFKTSVKVKQAKNVQGKDDCHFIFNGNWSKKDCTIYMENSSTKIAQIHPLQPSEMLKYCKNKFMVTIYPNIDYAFVVAIIAIVDAMKTPYKKQIMTKVGVAARLIGASASFL